MVREYIPQKGFPRASLWFVLIGSMAGAEVAADSSKHMKRVLVACSGSVAAIKIPKLVKALQNSSVGVRLRFINKL